MFSFLKEGLNVVHIGACTGEEAKKYDDAGVCVMWVEANPDSFRKLKYNTSAYPLQKSYNVCLSDVDDKVVDLWIATNQKNNDASSIMKPKMHSKGWNSVVFNNKIKVKTRRFDTFIEDNDLDPGYMCDCCVTGFEYKALVLDTQGSELKILRGIGGMLHHFKYVLTEAHDFELYEGCPEIQELKDYLGSFGFHEVKRRCAYNVPNIGKAYDILFSK